MTDDIEVSAGELEPFGQPVFVLCQEGIEGRWIACDADDVLEAEP